MKKVHLLFAFVLIVSASAAQIEKGTVFVGSSSNLGVNNSNPSNGNSTTVFNMNLKAGYFVMNNLTAGMRFDYNSGTSSTSIGIFGRYYVQGRVFVGLGVTQVMPNSGSSHTEVPIEVGYAAFINKNIAIEPSLVFTHSNSQDVVGLNLGFGLYFHRK